MSKDLLDLLDLCVKFAHKIEDQEQTIEERQEIIEELQEIIKDLQEENKRNIGHWLPVGKGYCYECSKCHKICYPKFPFCPTCGVRMEEVEPII